MIGIGVMLHELSGGNPNDPKKYYGLTIKDASVNEEEFNLVFDNGIKIRIWDNGQSCCESRYITCDDKPEDLIGNKLISIEVTDIKEEDNRSEPHEIAFITIQGDKTSVTFCTHNEHNGYYGGFGLTITEINKEN